MRVRRVVMIFASIGASLATSASAAPAPAGATVTGKLDLPARPPRPEPVVRGFLDRRPNPYTPPADVAVTPFMFVVLEGDAKPSSPPQITWELAGESFTRPVLPVPVGSEVTFKNSSKSAHSLAAAEDGKLIPPGPINPGPSGSHSFKVNEAGKIYTVGDADSPYLKGKLVVIATPFSATVDDAGKFEFTDVPEGAYKLRVFYKDGWLDVDQPVSVPAKGKADITAKVTAFAAAAKK